MSANAETLFKALQYALALLRDQPDLTRLRAAEEAAKQFDLGPLDEEWLLQQLTRQPPPS